jgi:hypothetical protein
LVGFISIGLRGGLADEPARRSADDVIALWTPKLEGVEDFQEWVAAPKDSSALAASTFRVVGPSFERLWNHYAGLCGIHERYKERQFLVSGGSGPRGTYVISERASSDGKGRGLSTFVLKTDQYTVTATIEPDPDGKAIRGSIAAVLP